MLTAAAVAAVGCLPSWPSDRHRQHPHHRRGAGRLARLETISQKGLSDIPESAPTSSS